MTSTNSAGQVIEQRSSAPSGSARDAFEAALLEALAHHHAGRLKTAETISQTLLEQRPGDADAQHLLGLIEHRLGRISTAVELIQQAVNAVGPAPHLLNSLGVVLMSAGRRNDAISAYRSALAIQPDYPEALTNLGVALKDAGQIDEAIACHHSALRLRPDYAEARSNLGGTYMCRGDVGAAIKEYETAVALAPNRPELYSNLGLALAAAKRYDEAVGTYSKALDVGPASAETYVNLGSALHGCRKLEEAAAAYRKAIDLRPSDATAYLNLCAVLKELERFHEALAAARQAVSLGPNLPEAHNNLGLILKGQGDLTGAIAAYRRAIALHAAFVDAHVNLGVALMEQLSLGEAEAAYRKALDLAPDNADAHWNLALLLLLTGNFADGWIEYEYGWVTKQGRGYLRHEGLPSWRGSDLRGKTILVWSEQGVGDQVMFASLLPRLGAMGARCIVEADARLAPLLTRSILGAEFVSPRQTRGGSLERRRIDFQAAMGSLCRWLRPDLGRTRERDGFLIADEARSNILRRRYVARVGERPLVGLSWRGGSGQSGRARSLRLPSFEPILRHPNVGFVSLQYGECAEEVAAASQELGVEILRDDDINPLASLDDLAAQISAMDLVVSIDNSTVHLAGALGKPVWVLLPLLPDWRWMLDREDSDWYASVRLFRQRRRGDWEPVISDVATRLAERFS